MISLPVYYENTGAINTSVIFPFTQTMQSRPHIFFCVEFLLLGSVVTPSAGTVTYDGTSIVNPDLIEPIDFASNIDASIAMNTLSVGANLVSMRVTTTGIVGADQIKFRAMGNKR